MNKFLSPLLSLCIALPLHAFAGPQQTDTQQKVIEAEKNARRNLLEQQKEVVDQMHLPPAQTLAEQPTLIELPVDDSDSPGATKNAPIAANKTSGSTQDTSGAAKK